MSKSLLALLGVVSLVLFLRLFHFTSFPSGLYWDELDTGYQAYSVLLTGRDYYGNPFPAHFQALADYRSGLYIYFTAPFVKFFGLNSFSIRAPSVIWSLLMVFIAFVFAARVLKLGRNSWLLPVVIGLGPWNLVQGRIAAESQLLAPLFLLGLIGLNSRRYLLSAFCFSLSLWAYPTAKLFIPMMLIALFFLNSNLKKKLVLPALLFSLIAFLPVFETFSKPVGRRFAELSIFNDPTLTKEVEVQRQRAYLASGATYQPGLAPGITEKIMFNKYTLFAQKLISNYFSSLNSDFLFLSGDPNLRHNINQPNTGQFYLIELAPFLAGLFLVLSQLKTNSNRLLAVLLLLAPLPAIVTGDGANHAPRLIYLFPIIASFIALGLNKFSQNKLIFSLYSIFFLTSLSLSSYYLFTTYKVASAESFNTGFLEAAAIADSQKGDYDRVVLDMFNESTLMAYLVTTQFNPAVFQASFPLPSETIANGVEGYKLGNVIILYPGTRDWNQIKLAGKNLILVRSTQPNALHYTPQTQILYPDSQPAISVFEK